MLWRIGTEPRAVRDVHALALSHLPGIRLVDPNQQSFTATPSTAPPTPSALFAPHRFGGIQPLLISDVATLASDALATTPPTTAALLRFSGIDSRPLKTEATESVTRSLLAVLPGTRPHETARIQVVLGSRLVPRAPARREGAPSPGRDEVASLREAGFMVAVRVGASASNDARARFLVKAMASAIRGLEVPRIRLRVWKSSPQTLAQAHTSWLLPMQLRTSELPALLAWPIVEGLPGVPSPHPVVLPPTSAVTGQSRRGLRSLGQSTALGAVSGRSEDASDANGTGVGLSPDDSLRHLHLLGPTGVGKSTVMAQLALQDIAAGRGVVVIDPKGDLVAEHCHPHPTRLPQ